MAYGNLNVDTITGSGASSVIVNNGTNNVAGFTTGNNLQILQNGGGIVFSNSSATTNSTLNDYETGTWTPSWASTGATFVYSTQVAKYTKIGNMVAIYGYIVCSSVSGTTSNGVSLSGLPFTSSNVSSFYQPISLGQLYNITWGGGFPTLYISPNSTSASFNNERNGTTETTVTASNVSSGSLMFSGVYQASF